MTAKKPAAKTTALTDLPRFEDVVTDLGHPDLTPAKTYDECVAIAWREVKK